MSEQPEDTAAQAPTQETVQATEPNADLPAQEARTMAMLAHLTALAGGLVTSAWGGGVACFVGPLIVWLLKKDQMPFVDDQGKEALNFNISVAVVFLVLFVLTILTFGMAIFITLPLWIIVGVFWLVCSIIASVKAYNGEAYRYPLTLRLLK